MHIDDMQKCKSVHMTCSPFEYALGMTLTASMIYSLIFKMNWATTAEQI